MPSMGMLGAMGGLGASIEDIGNSWLTEAKEKRIEELRAKNEMAQSEMDAARKKEMSDLEYSRSQADSETKFNREKELEGEKSKLSMERDKRKFENDRSLERLKGGMSLREKLAVEREKRRGEGSGSGKLGGYSQKDLESKIGTVVATGQRLNVDGLDWDADKEKQYAQVTNAVREEFMKNPDKGILGAYNSVVNPTTPVTEDMVMMGSEAAPGAAESGGDVMKPATPRVKPEDVGMSEGEFTTTVDQIRTLLNRGTDKATLREFALSKGTPEWKMDLLFEASGIE